MKIGCIQLDLKNISGYTTRVLNNTTKSGCIQSIHEISQVLKS